MATVVIIEDEQRIRELIARVLAERGHDVVSVPTAMEGLQAVVKGAPDLVILDMGLPDLDGTELLKMIRAVSEVPIVVATARSEDRDVIRTLDAGADDYLVKPFSIRELMIRVEHVIRRRNTAPESVIQHGELAIDLDSREVRVGDREVELTAKEFDLLALLAGSPRRVFDRDLILAHVWHSSDEWQSTGTISEHVHRLRRKLDPDHRDRWIVTRRGMGYRFVP
jgi:DNA-binding response OmpR family regulator